VIREVYHRPGAGAPAGPTWQIAMWHPGPPARPGLTEGVFRVDRDGRARPGWHGSWLTGRPQSRTEEGRRDTPLSWERREFPGRGTARAPKPGHRARRPVRSLVTEYPPWASTVRQPPPLWRKPRRPGLAGLAHPCPPRPKPGPGARPAHCTTCRQYEGRPGCHDLAAARRRCWADLDGRVPAEHRQLYELNRRTAARGRRCQGPCPRRFIHPDPVRKQRGDRAGRPGNWWTGTGAGNGPGRPLASLAGPPAQRGPHGTPGRRAGPATASTCDLTPRRTPTRLEGVLWIRILWLSAWQLPGWPCVLGQGAPGLSFPPPGVQSPRWPPRSGAHSGRPA